MEPKHRFFIASLGCPKNLVESELISGAFLAAGDTICLDPDDADIYLINTCAFLPSARGEAAAEIADAVAWKHRAPGRRIAVAGCLMNHPQFPEFEEHFQEVDLWCHVNDTARVRELLLGDAKPSAAKRCTYLCDESMPRIQLTMPHIAYLKISDGCNNRCAYCAIPALRGALRSRPMPSILAEASTLVGNGVRELIVIAQDTTAYGHDLQDGSSLAGLLEQLAALSGNFVIRLLYTHPAHYTGRLIGVLADHAPKILPYLDMPLQHISDRLLSAMNRHIDSRGIRALTEKLRGSIPGLTLRTTFITGLPGETDEEFAGLCSFVREYGFERMGVFSYAPEPGTKAAGMEGQISAEVADARAAELMRIQRRIMLRSQRGAIGSTLRVLVDRIDDGVAFARGAADAPEIDNKVIFPATRSVREGEFVDVKIIKAAGDDLAGEKLRKRSC